MSSLECFYVRFQIFLIFPLDLPWKRQKTSGFLIYPRWNKKGQKEPLAWSEITHLTFTCLKSTIETLEKVWNMLKINNKNIRTMSVSSFWFFTVNFEHISHLFLVFLLFSLWAGNWLLGKELLLVISVKVNCKNPTFGPWHPTFLWVSHLSFFGSLRFDYAGNISRGCKLKLVRGVQ